MTMTNKKAIEILESASCDAEFADALNHILALVKAMPEVPEGYELTGEFGLPRGYPFLTDEGKNVQVWCETGINRSYPILRRIKPEVAKPCQMWTPHNSGRWKMISAYETKEEAKEINKGYIGDFKIIDVAPLLEGE